MTNTILEQYRARTPRSAELHARARAVLPGGIVTDTRYFDPYGIYVTGAAGTRKWDVDGNEYLDFFGGHGANILGHAPPLVVNAVREAVATGVQFAANQPLEVMLAEVVKALMPSLERLRFTASGTEATLLALRLARAFTRRPKIVRFLSNYHGWHDHTVSGYLDQFDGTAAVGVLPEIAANTVLIRPNDTPALHRVAAEQGSQIAAFLIEPVGTHFGVVPTTPSFLREVQRVARSVGATFVLDEVLSGFRVALGGAQSLFDLQPDLTTLGKILCGGMPGGAVGGRAEILDLLDFDEARRGGRAKVLHQGTFTANPVSMAAGLAMLGHMTQERVCERVNQLGEHARQMLNDVCESERLPFRWYGEFSAFHLLAAPEITRRASLEEVPMEVFLDKRQPLMNRLRMAFNIQGIDVNTRCSGLLGAAHTGEDLQRACKALAVAGRMLREEGFLK